MEKLVLTREGDKVFHNGVGLAINLQKTKVNKDGSLGQPTVKIEGLPGSNGSKWLSLSKIQEGTHSYSVQGATRSSSPKPQSTKVEYYLTKDEKGQIETLDSRIQKLIDQKNSIIDDAKARYIPEPDLSPERLSTLSIEEVGELLEQLKKHVSQKRENL